MKLLLLLFSFSALAQSLGLFPPSASRDAGESFEDAMARNLHSVHKAVGAFGVTDSPHIVARTIDKYEFPEMESWSSYKEVRDAFRYVRDARFIDWEYQDEEFMRRSSWLYPDDGCFIRAELMIENLEDRSEPLPKKIFVFGSLTVKTDNSASGKVSWWYHVAPIVAYKNNHYVIDPALKTKKPLKLKSWLKLMTDDIDKLKIAICDSRTMAPNDSCYDPMTYSLDKVMEYQYYFLDREWYRVKALGRDPVKLLGDNPPWKFMLFGFIPMER